MKKFSLLLCALLIGAFAFSQQKAMERAETMSLGTQNAFVLDLPEIEIKTAENYWEDYVKDDARMKWNRKSEQFHAEGVSIPLISSKELDMYSKFEEFPGQSRLYVWIDNQEAFISSKETPDEAKNALEYINDFAVVAEKRHVEELLEDSEKDLSSLEKDLINLGKDKEKYQENIEEAKEEIIENEANIKQNTIYQETKAAEIDAQKSKIMKLKERLLSVGIDRSKL